MNIQIGDKLIFKDRAWWKHYWDNASVVKIDPYPNGNYAGNIRVKPLHCYECSGLVSVADIQEIVYKPCTNSLTKTIEEVFEKDILGYGFKHCHLSIKQEYASLVYDKWEENILCAKSSYPGKTIFLTLMSIVDEATLSAMKEEYFR